MNIEELLALEFGKTISVFNQPFTYVGRAEVKLDDESQLVWLYNDEQGMLAIAPDEDELILFDKIDDEIEPSETILYQGQEHEFDYENAGNVGVSEGNAPAEEDDRYLFSDYQAADGEKIRIVRNENTGDALSYFGRAVTEEDISEV